MQTGRAIQDTIVIRGINGSNGTDGKGIASASYNSSTGVLTITFTDSSIYQTGDIRGVKGDKGDTGNTGATGSTGKGISSTSYNSGTGVLTITFSDASTYQTGDIRGAKGDTGNTGAAGPNQVNTSTPSNINGILKANGSVVSAATPGTDYVIPSDSRLTDARTPSDTSVTYAKVASALKTKSTVTSSINLSASGQGEITLSGNTAFSFSGYELNKTFLLIVNANGFTLSFATAARHAFVDGNATIGTSGTFYISMTCINATSGSEKLLTTIMKGV